MASKRVRELKRKKRRILELRKQLRTNKISFKEFVSTRQREDLFTSREKRERAKREISAQETVQRGIQTGKIRSIEGEPVRVQTQKSRQTFKRPVAIVTDTKKEDAIRQARENLRPIGQPTQRQQLGKNLRLKMAIQPALIGVPVTGKRPIKLTVSKIEQPPKQETKSQKFVKTITTPVPYEKIPVIGPAAKRDIGFRLAQVQQSIKSGEKLATSKNKLVASYGKLKTGLFKTTKDATLSFSAEARKPSTYLIAGTASVGLRSLKAGASLVSGTGTLAFLRSPVISRTARLAPSLLYGGYQTTQVVRGKKSLGTAIGQTGAMGAAFRLTDPVIGAAQTAIGKGVRVVNAAGKNVIVKSSLKLQQSKFTKELRKEGITFKEFQQRAATKALLNLKQKNPALFEQKKSITVVDLGIGKQGKPTVNVKLVDLNLGKEARIGGGRKQILETVFKSDLDTNYIPVSQPRVPRYVAWYKRNRFIPRTFLNKGQPPAKQDTSLLLLPGITQSQQQRRARTLIRPDYDLNLNLERKPRIRYEPVQDIKYESKLSTVFDYPSKQEQEPTGAVLDIAQPRPPRLPRLRPPTGVPRVPVLPPITPGAPVVNLPKIKIRKRPYLDEFLKFSQVKQYTPSATAEIFNISKFKKQFKSKRSNLFSGFELRPRLL